MTAELAVLGLLVEQPLHGYAIERLIDERGMRKWTAIGFSSIYQILDQLVSSGRARVEVEPAPGRGKERRVHRVTPDGRGYWEDQALSALADTDADTGAFLLALSGLPFLDPGDVVEALDRRVARLESELTDLRSDLEAVRPVPPHVQAMFSFVSNRLASERDWTRNYLTTLPEGEETTP